MPTRTLIAVLLIALFWLSLSAIAFSQTTISAIPETQQYPELELWMVGERNIEFYRRGWWLLGYDSTMKVKWGERELYVKDLTEQQKTYLWELMSPGQRRQMSDEYGKIGFGMGGHLMQRPAEWGPVLNERIASYFRGVSGWAEVARRRHEAQIPPEVPAFLAEKDTFLQNHGARLTPEQTERINAKAAEVEQAGSLIATIELKRIEVAVKGLSAGLLGIISDYMTGFVTHGASAASELIATIASQMMAIGQQSGDRPPTPAEQIQIMNGQVAAAKSEMLAEMDRQRAMWRGMIGEEEEPQEQIAADPQPQPADGPWPTPARSICYLVDVSGSMAGRKLAEARDAVRASIAATDDGNTEWALLSFGGCRIHEVHGFTQSAAAIVGAVESLSASGDTPMTYAMFKAAAYVADEGRGTVSRRMIVLCDGQDNCRERDSVTQEEAMAGLRTIIREIRVPTSGGTGP